MKIKNYLLGTVAFVALGMTSCSSDDDAPAGVIAPETYTFTRGGSSTVSYSGQSTRIAMAEELGDALNLENNTNPTIAALTAMYDHQEGVADFSDADLNASNKQIRSKVAASYDLFNTNLTDGTAIKNEIQAFITSQVNDVFPNINNIASAGQAGQVSDGSTRYVTAKGLENNQAVLKTLIGALMTDQLVNNYLSTGVLDAGDNRVNNDADILEEGKDYTTMEHKWDEAYGYLYGASVNQATPNLDLGADSFLNKYLGRVEGDADFTGIADEIYQAFKLGRAAIVAKDYVVRDAQAAIIKQAVSKVIGVRAVHYLKAGKAVIDDSTADRELAFHDLSEGYGFVKSLQFAYGSNGSIAFSKSEVDGFILVLESGDGFWDLTSAELDDMINAIAAKFDFTADQA